MNTFNQYELNMNEVEEVSGGIVPIVVAAFYVGYLVGRNSK